MNFFGILENLLEEPQIRFDSAKCRKTKYADYVCDECIKVCPLQAIENSGSIKVNQEKCDACGLCAGICPGEAFYLVKPSYGQLAAEALEKREITFTCQRKQCFGAAAVPCLGYLPETLLMGFVLSCNRVRIIFDAKRCDGCSRKAGPLIAERLSWVKELAFRFGKAGTMLFDDGNQDKVISRGEFFALLKDRTRSLARQVPAPLSEDGPEKSLNKKSLPASRKLFLKMLHENAADKDKAENNLPAPEPVLVSGDNWPFSQIRVEDSCSGCGDCTLFCPTGALRLEDRGEGKELLHTPALCLNCRLCIAKCPRQAISRPEVLDLSLVLTGASIPVKSLNAAPCARCGRPVNVTAPTRQIGFCSLCEQESGLRVHAKKLMLNF